MKKINEKTIALILSILGKLKANIKYVIMTLVVIVVLTKWWIDDASIEELKIFIIALLSGL